MAHTYTFEGKLFIDVSRRLMNEDALQENIFNKSLLLKIISEETIR